MSRPRRPTARAAPSIGPLSRHGFIVPSVCKIFEDLAIGASLVWEGEWRPILGRAQLLNYELEHGRISDRYKYNDRCVSRVEQERSSVLGTHGGFCDWFVPVCVQGRPRAVLVVGPFCTHWPSAPEVQERWHWLTGSEGHLADPEFDHYVSTTLSLSVFEGKSVLDLRRLLECLASLIACEGDADHIRIEIAALRERLLGATFVERVWAAARLMVDERTHRVWSTSARRGQRPDLRLNRYPEHVAVGLLASTSASANALDDLLRRNAFQRACVELAAQRGDVMSGRLGDYGVTFLSAKRGSNERSKARLSELCQQAISLARRRFGLSACFGISVLSSKIRLPAQYQAALAAAESALTTHSSFHYAETTSGPSQLIGGLRAELVELLQLKPTMLLARFDRFLEAVAARTAFRPEPARVHLEIAFEQLSAPLLRARALEPKDLEALQRTLERSARESQTLLDLFAVYRAAVGQLALAVGRPRAAQHERSVRRALDYCANTTASPSRWPRPPRSRALRPPTFRHSSAESAV